MEALHRHHHGDCLMKFELNEGGTYSLTMNAQELTNHMRVLAVLNDRWLRDMGVTPAAVTAAYELYSVIEALTGIDGRPGS